MKYKAKETAKKAKGLEAVFKSRPKVEKLLAGEVVEITAPTKEMLKYIKEVKDGTGN